MLANTELELIVHLVKDSQGGVLHSRHFSACFLLCHGRGDCCGDYYAQIGRFYFETILDGNYEVADVSFLSCVERSSWHEMDVGL